MDKQTLSNYGWLVIVTLVLAVMLALATPFGTYVGDAVVGVANGFVNTNNKQISNDNLEYAGYQWDNKLDVLNPKGVIPEGATYTLTDGTVLSAGDRFPKELTNGDIYTYGDYEYCYQYIWCPYCDVWASKCEHNLQGGGWSVHCINDIATPGFILESINNKAVRSMMNTFNNCKNLVTAPKIPENVRDISWAFNGCTSLINAPKISDEVNNMCYTFHNCKSLVVAPKIPNKVTNLGATFLGCTSLEVAPIIPSKARDMSSTFAGCTSLKGQITINATPAGYTNCLIYTQITEILGNCTIKEEILATTKG